MVEHQVEQDLDVALAAGGHKAVKGGQVAVFGGHGAVVAHVVAKVHLGRGKERAEPDGTYAQGLQVVEGLDHALEVADAIAVAVAKRPRPHLVEHPVFVPVTHGGPLGRRAVFAVLR